MPTHTAGDDANYLDVAPSTSQNKYALLMVPDYDAAVGNQTSFISLGASTAPSNSYSVWARFEGTTKGTRDHTDGNRRETTVGSKIDVIGGNYEIHIRGTTAPTSYGTDAEKEIFRDNDQAYFRIGLTDKDPYLPAFIDADAAKKAEIDDIVTSLKTATTGPTKFGWEDHSAGHRLTTTAGDKVEIVKGKSYIHVLGADDFDVSEGQKSISRSGSDPQAEGYSAAQNGSKRPFIVERTWARRAISETWMGLDKSTPASKLLSDANITLESFPEVIDGEQREYVYAKKLSSYTGASDAWVETVTEDTYANTITSTTTADAINERTMVKGGMASTTLCPFVADTRVSVASLDVSVDAFRGEFALGGLTLAIEVGGKIEITGPTKFRTEINVPKKVEVNVEKLETTLNTITTVLTENKVALSSGKTAASITMAAMITKLGI